MSSPTQTHVDFVKQPMGQKVVTKLAGVGPVLGERLAKAGFDKARVVLGKFLILKEDEEKFKRWFKETTKANDMETTGANDKETTGANDKTTGANEAHAAACYNCLKEWCKAHL
jgi:hypothetical protein